jgi:hypothetical protein
MVRKVCVVVRSTIAILSMAFYCARVCWLDADDGMLAVRDALRPVNRHDVRLRRDDDQLRAIDVDAVDDLTDSGLTRPASKEGREEGRRQYRQRSMRDAHV